VSDRIQLTLGDVEAQSRDLAAKIRASGTPDLLVGIANGALLPTKVVAEYLGVPFEMVQVRRRGSRYKDLALRVLSTLHIPTSIFNWGPLLFLVRLVQERTGDVEETKATFSFPVRGKRIVIVDDAIHTGTSARYVLNQLITSGAEKVMVAVLDWYQGVGDSGEWKPDIYLTRSNGQWYPWSYNSPFHADYLKWLSAHGPHL
jgi:hypoxanthine phosphoribosyltransferase